MKLKQHIKLVRSFGPTINEWKNKFDSTEYKEASKLNYALFGIHLNKKKNCDCVNDLISYIGRLDNEKIKQKQKVMESKFRLKKGTLIQLHGLDIMISEANLTDAKAISLLKKYPSHISSFESYPENWENLISDQPVVITPIEPKNDSIEPSEEVAVEKESKKGKRKGKK